jgi:DNA polymerase-4
MRKPDATTVITKDNYRDKVWPLPADELLFIGRATKRRLAEMGMYLIGDVARASAQQMQAALGKNGLMLRRYARGEDDAPVLWAEEADEIKSVGNSTTTPRDLCQEDDAKAVLYLLADSVAARLRAHRFACRTVSVWMRDSELGGLGRQCRLKRESDCGSDIARAAVSLLREHYDWRLPLRSLGVCGSDLISTFSPLQMPLWEPGDVRRARALDGALDSIRARWGHNSIRRGLMLMDREALSINPVDDHGLQPLGAMHGRG